MQQTEKRRWSAGQAERTPLTWAFALALTLLVVAFLMVGGAREDLESLLLWRPLSLLLFALAIGLCWRDAWTKARPVLLFVLALLALTVLHLVPLPPAVWSALPGREMIAEIYRDAGMALPWQPLSVVQARTWNALFSLGAPIAMFGLAVGLSEYRQRWLLVVLIGLGFASGLLGLLQAIGPSDGALYFYRITNNDSSVGLFANRNHQAIFLATIYPLLAANLSLFRGKPDKLFFQRVITFGGVALLIPLILMTGSRAGLIMAIVGMALAWWVYRPPVQVLRAADRLTERQKHWVGYGLFAALFSVVLVVAVRTPALGRLLETDASSEMRVKALPVIFQAIGDFFPVGSGIGTFVEVYKAYEPDRFISPQYFNHAHNDVVEVLLTAGIPGLLLMLWFAGLAFCSLRSLWRNRHVVQGERGYSAQVMGRAGLSVLTILAVSSIADYPLRVPSLMLLAAIAAAWASIAYRNAQK